MKKTISILSLLLCLLLFVGCVRTVGEEELISVARRESGISEPDTTEIVLAGESRKDGKVLFWFISGNEYQMHNYIPIEFTEVGDDRYNFVQTYSNYERADEIGVTLWQRGYSFLINNENCACIRIKTPVGDILNIEVESIPFAYYYDFSEYHFDFTMEYHFIDKDGNDMCG